MLNTDNVSCLRGEELGVLTLSLLLGMPTLGFIGAIGAALTLGVRNSRMLIALLVLLLCISLLVFGVGAVTTAHRESV